MFEPCVKSGVKGAHSIIPGTGQLMRASRVYTQRLRGLVCETDNAMTRHLQQPSKECVREWLRARIAARRPPPDAQQIRRELGWELIKTPMRKRR
jgi:hypothetical protein